MKPFLFIILIIFISILIFAGLLYWTLRTKTKIVTNVEPYAGIMNKKLELDRDVLLVKNRSAYVHEKAFLIVERNQVLDKEITERHLLKAGTTLTLNRAKLFKNGTSGFTASVVFGIVSTDLGDIEFEYVWGDEHTTLASDEPNFFTYKNPIWKSINNDLDKRYTFD